MNLMEAIECRRSVRAYKSDAVPSESIDTLLHAAVQAPSGMNDQPWVFGVIQDPATLSSYSERTKALLLASVDKMHWLAQYQEHFADPNYSVFYHAPALIVIMAKDSTPLAQIDCSLAAENLMLAACDLGLGTCWIGFAGFLLNQPDVKQELGIPDGYAVVAPIIVGYPEGPIPPREKNPPEVIFRK